MKLKVNGLSRSDLSLGIRALETMADHLKAIHLVEPELDRFSTRELVEVFNAYVDVRQAREIQKLNRKARRLHHEN
jgi:hypothetical protein